MTSTNESGPCAFHKHPVRAARVKTATRRSMLPLAILFLVASFAVLAAPASAATCSGSSCAGINPSVSSCQGDARTILARDHRAEGSASFRIEMRYSPSCQSAWGRLVTYSGSNVGFALSAWNPNKPSVGVAGGSGNTVWTAMIDGRPLDCAGSHFYANGRWMRWYYLGCA